jgi:tRNA (cmo5U34)-methyltransferase
MQNQEQAVVFDEERAATYDERFAKLAPLRDTLHLLTRSMRGFFVSVLVLAWS